MPGKGESVIPYSLEDIKAVMSELLRTELSYMADKLFDLGNIPQVSNVRCSGGLTGSTPIKLPDRAVVYVTIANFSTADLYLAEVDVTDPTGNVGLYGKIAAGASGTILVIGGRGVCNLLWKGAADPEATFKVIVSGHNLGPL